MALNYRADPFWTSKKLTPALLQCHDISLKQSYQRQQDRLEVDEILSSNLIPEVGFGQSIDLQDKWARTWDDVTRLDLSSRIEEQNLSNAFREYGWLSEVRLQEGSEDDHVECRWIHVSSKFRNNLAGILIGMSDWSARGHQTIEALRRLEQITTDQERFSKHGKIFAPFCAPLTTDQSSGDHFGPMLMSMPFLDWTVHPDKETPALRFQIDEREDFHSMRASSHPLRSLLQYYYRLEDTSERERKQVFAKHRPWYTDRDTDLRVRRWYGHYPSGVVVDELWVLIIDERHIVSFSANQSWKARWPPLQLSSRIWELSFRSLREKFRHVGNKVKYSSIFHAVACLHGAVGLMHRSFWADLPLPCAERYGGYFSHLRYRIYRAPSTRLVMELLQIQDELNIIDHIIQQQQQILAEFHEVVSNRSANHVGPVREDPNVVRNMTTGTDTTAHSTLSSSRDTFAPVVTERAGQWAGISPASSAPMTPAFATTSASAPVSTPLGPIYAPSQTTPGTANSFTPLSTTMNSTRDPSTHPSPPHTLFNTIFTDLHTKLRLEKDDLSALLTSTNDLLTRTIQLVNIRIEDHGQAILVFTVVTVIFLPLSFTTSFFGMNTRDIRDLDRDQSIFWASALGLTTLVVALSGALAFYGGRWKERLADWQGGYIPHQGGRGWIPRLLFGGNTSGHEAFRTRGLSGSNSASRGGGAGGGGGWWKRRSNAFKQQQQRQQTTTVSGVHSSRSPGQAVVGFHVLDARKVDGINIERSRPGP